MLGVNDVALIKLLYRFIFYKVSKMLLNSHLLTIYPSLIVAEHFLMKHQGGHGSALGTGKFVQNGGAVDELIKSLGGVRR